MKNFKLSLKTIILLIVAFFVIVGLLAAIAALSAKSKKQNGQENVVTIPAANNVTNTYATSSPVSNNTTSNNTTRGGRTNTGSGFGNYESTQDLIMYFEDPNISSMVAYSACGNDMESLKDKLDIDLFYKEEIEEDEIEKLAKLFQKAATERNQEQFNIEEDGIPENLYATKFIVIDEEFYIGISDEYFYAYNDDNLDVFKISGELSKFATKMPEEVDLEFETFKLTIEENSAEINFDDRGEVDDLKGLLSSYELEDADTDDFELWGQIEFDNREKLSIYKGDDYPIGEYKVGKKSTLVMLNKEFVDKLMEIADNALN